MGTVNLSLSEYTELMEHKKTLQKSIDEKDILHKQIEELTMDKAKIAIDMKNKELELLQENENKVTIVEYVETDERIVAMHSPEEVWERVNAYVLNYHRAIDSSRRVSDHFFRGVFNSSESPHRHQQELVRYIERMFVPKKLPTKPARKTSTYSQSILEIKSKLREEAREELDENVSSKLRDYNDLKDKLYKDDEKFKSTLIKIEEENKEALTVKDIEINTFKEEVAILNGSIEKGYDNATGNFKVMLRESNQEVDDCRELLNEVSNIALKEMPMFGSAAQRRIANKIEKFLKRNN